MSYLNGHDTGSAKTHLASCCQEFDSIIDRSHIIFDTKYHGNNSEKQAVIRNLQLYGSIEAPTSFLARTYAQLRSIFWTYKVGMAGDGDNDVAAALRQADFSVGVYTNKNNLNKDVNQAANFSMAQTELHQLPTLITMDHTHIHT